MLFKVTYVRTVVLVETVSAKNPKEARAKVIGDTDGIVSSVVVPVGHHSSKAVK